MADCSGLWLDTYVCVGVPGTPTTRPPATPTPVQDGIASSCSSFYKVQKGDNCQKVVANYKGQFSLSDFYKWNPAVGVRSEEAIKKERKKGKRKKKKEAKLTQPE